MGFGTNTPDSSTSHSDFFPIFFPITRDFLSVRTPRVSCFLCKNVHTSILRHNFLNYGDLIPF